MLSDVSFCPCGAEYCAQYIVLSWHHLFSECANIHCNIIFWENYSWPAYLKDWYNADHFFTSRFMTLLLEIKHFWKGEVHVENTHLDQECKVDRFGLATHVLADHQPAASLPCYLMRGGVDRCQHFLLLKNSGFYPWLFARTGRDKACLLCYIWFWI